MSYRVEEIPVYVLMGVAGSSFVIHVCVVFLNISFRLVKHLYEQLRQSQPKLFTFDISVSVRGLRQKKLACSISCHIASLSWHKPEEELSMFIYMSCIFQ